MRGSPRPRARHVALVAGLATLACSSGAPAPQRCETASECPAGARCISTACVANAPPIPEVVLPSGPLQANVLLSLDASSSHDPDADDAIVSYAWTFRADPAPCTPPVVAGTLSLATVRFGCAGRYSGDVTVTDALGAAATKTFALDVVAGPTLVTAGSDLSVEHACTSLPTRCTPAGAITLSAATPDVPPEGVSFRWIVEPPPDRPLDANRRVVFAPSDAVSSPSVSIETDGQAMSGDWVFRVEARDAAGLIGTAATRVSVGNRPPVVTKTVPLPPHAFDGARRTASGEVPFTISDPDGDALVGPSVEWRHAGDGEGTFTGGLLAEPSRVTFAISVAYATPDDAAFLIGGAGLERSIEFRVSDVNGGVAAESWPIVVGNRPPVLVSAPAPFTVNHSYDAIGLAYRAAAALSTWSDPDGDPLLQVPSSDTGDPDCPTFSVAAGPGPRVATVDCALGFVGAPVVGNFARTHAVLQRVQDPWDPAAQTSTVTFTIGNRPPTVTSSVLNIVAGSCVASGWCDPEGTQRRYTANPAVASVPSRWADPDGDPLSIQAGAAMDVTQAQPLVCIPSDCVLELDVSRILGVCGSTSRAVSATASDGAASVSSTIQIERTCDPL